MKKMLERAIMLATHGHSHQFDKGGQPYILHPIAVMNMLETDDEEIQCIAIMHDLIEDSQFTEEDLRTTGFSERVIAGVLALTRNDSESYNDYKRRVMANEDAMVVKLCDLRHNSDIRRLKGVTEKDIQRMKKYHTFYLEIINKLNNG